jgi:hypothetical protein
MKYKQQFKRKVLILFLCVSLIIITMNLSCDFETNEPFANRPPNTTLANIPVEGDTLYALVTLAWDGEDNDGFIAKYRYRYTTYYMEEGQTIEEVNPDSIVVHNWIDTTETSVTIAFDSPSPVNYQYFEVVAIDNNDNVDPTPATKKFFTLPTSFPDTEILIPQTDREDVFAKETVDDWWPGIPLRMSASDADGQVIEYAWKVNDGEWHWTEDSIVYIHPSEFIPLEETHWIHVISRDNTNLLDPVPASRRIDIWVPTFENDIIIIDDTNEDISFAGQEPPYDNTTDAKIDSFYFDIFGGNRGDLEITQWDFSFRGMISMRRLKDYKMIIWHKDQYDYTAKNFIRNEKLIKDYLHVGGKLVFSGHRLLGQYMDQSYERPPPEAGWLPPLLFKPGQWNSFVYDYLHVQVADVTKIEGTLESIKGANSNFTGEIFPEPAKIPARFPYYGQLGHIFAFDTWGGFTVPIYTYHGSDPRVDGKVCGLRYFGSVYDLIYLGFPLWYLQYDGAKQIGDDILKSMGF